MIIIFENGRFGNQLFQINYVFNLIKRHEKVFFIGYNQTKFFFRKQKNFFFIDNKFLIKRRFKIIKYLKKMRLFSLVLENFRGSKISIYMGLFKKIRFVDGFFQSEEYINQEFLEYFSTSKKYIEENKKAKNIIFKKKIEVFIHIRLKDYKKWPSKDYPAIMNQSWYKKYYLKYFNKKNSFIFSDDIKNLKKNSFYKEKKFKIMHTNYIETFFLMKNCKYAIISSSSFSWWATYLSYKEKSKTMFIAPNFWAGNKIKKFLPHKIKSNHLVYK